ncbi:type IV-A pilus assembly ATPase PilB [Paucibacter sp. O1-1]|uniref:type IV-A pilus assembly ATPase PilB n=1 Tax=Paucibacter sp. M5-1 TaxID=3015998 RepID=UPI0021D4DA11|nr:type IV-A pilus assembly ATPase PilB [Paucibacter sp. M5-1]MCU7373531.1 type IV-A pilus assembly ATPase PilB [Paucibacter sp. O1-1]MCZ7879823.1 type IV-A pilus assembly ATPase PilB [Paucibacter sp. M5-1]MDA3828531.1 type IV-A pilus assembly ATPase PilB [Paucibacter sp. O1-1]
MDTTLIEPPHSALSGVARVLVHAGKLPVKTAEDLARQAREKKISFVSSVMAANAVSPTDLAHTLSLALALPVLDLNAMDPQRMPSNVIDNKLAQQYQVVVLGRRGNRLFIGGADPTDQEVVERIKFATQLAPEWVIVEYDKLTKMLQGSAATAAETLDAIAGGDFDFDIAEEDSSAAQESAADIADVEDAPVVRFLQKMLVDAINMRASDLHFEPYEYHYRVRFRVDGELREITQPPIAIKDKLSSRIKVISRLDIAERRVPQDGRMKLKFGAKSIDFRISTLPTLFGEKIVIRILDSSSAKLGIEALGYEKIEKDRLMACIQRPYGMVLVTGPTGSGKTVSLYTCLNILNQPGVNISTVEDPAEINLPGINQVNVNDKAGLTFAAALKSFLRQDPDIIMVGEIRDLETADIAIKAAQTGHMVMSTLHTNDAPTTLTRLLNMGVAPFNIASSVLLITAQRLVRRLCEHCKAPAEYPREALLRGGFVEEDLDGSWKPYRAVGCSSCNNGYRGRVGLYQVMPITEAIQRIILSEGTSMDIAVQAQAEGVRDLRQSGLVKVRAGVTTLEEVLAATNE